ncbi:MAG: hypothetical protein QG653_717 [Patescibacteria group bacterium]|nr:hypothetical protein [Patescibacteria group bacterium]
MQKINKYVAAVSVLITLLIGMYVFNKNGVVAFFVTIKESISGMVGYARLFFMVYPLATITVGVVILFIFISVKQMVDDSETK